MEFCIRLALCFLIAHYFSVVASGDFLYLFYGEYGYPGTYDSLAYDPAKEWLGQCISIARIRLSDLDDPQGKARRWDGQGFTVPWDSIGRPVAGLQIPRPEGGGAAASPTGGFHWGPSVSWNTPLELLGHADGQGNRAFMAGQQPVHLFQSARGPGFRCTQNRVSEVILKNSC